MRYCRTDADAVHVGAFAVVEALLTHKYMKVDLVMLNQVIELIIAPIADVMWKGKGIIFSPPLQIE